MTLAEVEIPKTKEELEAQLMPNPFFEVLEEETVSDTTFLENVFIPKALEITVGIPSKERIVLKGRKGEIEFYDSNNRKVMVLRGSAANGDAIAGAVDAGTGKVHRSGGVR